MRRLLSVAFGLLVLMIILDNIQTTYVGEVPTTGPIQIKVQFSMKCAQFGAKPCPDSFVQVPCYPSLRQAFILIAVPPYYRIALYADQTQGISKSGGYMILDT